VSCSPTVAVRWSLAEGSGGPQRLWIALLAVLRDDGASTTFLGDCGLQLRTFGGRPHLGPHALAVGEATAAAFSQAPAVHDVDDLQRTLGAFNAFLAGALRREITERRTARATGTDVAAFQATHGPYLARMLETGRYPTINRLVVDGAHLDAEQTFEHNLTTVLDGITSPSVRE